MKTLARQFRYMTPINYFLTRNRSNKVQYKLIIDARLGGITYQ